MIEINTVEHGGSWVLSEACGCPTRASRRATACKNKGGGRMKLYTVTQIYNGTRDFQHIRANSREEAIKIAREMKDWEDWVNESFDDDWFAEVEEEEA